MLIEQAVCIRNASGDLIRGDLRYSESPAKKPLIIICHGFTAHKDWGPFPYFGRKLAQLGFATVVFNFSHNGVGADSTVFSEYQKFSRNTPGKELEDVRAIIDAVDEKSIGREVVDPGRIGMAGHSRGGGISILTAVSNERVGSVVTWSTVATFLRYTKHQREEWEQRGYLPLRFGEARTLLRYDVSVLHDLEENKERYDLRLAASRLKVPTLYLHGEADVIVRPEEAEELRRLTTGARSEFVLLRGAPHMYGATHPFRETNPTIEHLLELTASWFHETL
jgi:pimeloyl-ACP methyl ester carboxylesterase